MYTINPFRCMVIVVHNARVLVENWRPTEWKEMVIRRSEGTMQRDGWYWRRVRSNPPSGCPWRLWWSPSTLMDPIRPDGNVFCWWSIYAEYCGKDIWYQSHHGSGDIYTVAHTWPPVTCHSYIILHFMCIPPGLQKQVYNWMNKREKRNETMTLYTKS